MDDLYGMCRYSESKILTELRNSVQASVNQQVAFRVLQFVNNNLYLKIYMMTMSLRDGITKFAL